MNFCFLSLRAASRTPPSPWDTLSRPCVRCVWVFSVFLLVERLPSMRSAEARGSSSLPSWFAHFVGTTRSSDSLQACMLVLWLWPSPAGPSAYRHGHLQGLPVLARGVFKHAWGL